MTPQAQQIVDRFKPYAGDHGIYWGENIAGYVEDPDWQNKNEQINAIQCAIVAVEMQMEIAELCMESYTYDRLAKILTELKNELK